MSARKGPHAVLGDDHVERVIVRLARHGGYFLSGIGNSDGANAWQRIDGAVVVTAAIAEAMTRRIERQKRNEYDRGHDIRRACKRFADAPSVGRERVAGFPRTKYERG